MITPRLCNDPDDAVVDDGLISFHYAKNGCYGYIGNIRFPMKPFHERLAYNCAIAHVTMASSSPHSIWLILYYIVPNSVAGLAYGWEVGSMGGEFFGSLLISLTISDRLGRRLTIVAAAIIYLIGQAIIVAANNQAMFIAGRVINGCGAGPLFQTMSFYTAEITPHQIRGRGTATLNSGIALGLLVAYWVQYGAFSINGNAAWRLWFALQLVPGAVVGAVMLFRPESPRWLIQHDRQDETLQILADLHGQGDRNNLVARSEFEEILMVAAKVFAQTGRTGTNAALLANGISSALLLVATVSLTIMIDYYGRRKPIFLGHISMGTCLLVVASVLATYGSPHFDATSQMVQLTFKHTAAGYTAVAFMFLFMVCFGALSSSIPWTYQSEVFPVNARARGTALSTTTNYLTNFWLGLYIPQALNAVSWKIYYLFGATNVSLSVVGYLFFPETAGISLEELDLLFTPDITAVVFLDTAACSKHSMLQHGLNDDPEAVASELREKLAQSN